LKIIKSLTEFLTHSSERFAQFFSNLVKNIIKIFEKSSRITWMEK